MRISPSNVTEITLALFYITDQEVRKKYTADALDLVDKLSQAWYRCTHTDSHSNTAKLESLIIAAREVISILKPTVKLRIAKQVNCMG